MFEVLVFMFENYFEHHSSPDDKTMEQELSAAGFEQSDILGAFDWFEGMKSMLDASNIQFFHTDSALRVFTEAEIKKISIESLGFLLFLQQAKVIDDVERELIIDRVMALRQAEVNIEETRWITMITLWNKGRQKDYLFVEDALINPRSLTAQ